MPGILEGRLLADEGLKAGLTSSPDFFLSMGGFRRDRFGSSSSVTESSSDPVRGVSGWLCLMSMKIDVSVFDLLWPSFRRVLTVVSSIWVAVGLSSDSEGGMMSVSAWLAFPVSSAFLFGELSLCCSIILMAACSSARFSNSRPLNSFVSSSSLEFCAESGGEMTAPAGI